MGFQSLKTSDVKTFENEGQELIGYYMGTQHGQGQDNNSCVHTIEKEDGESVQFWGSAVCDEQIAKIKAGDFVKVVYLGKVKTKTGNREYRNWEVFVDHEKSKVIASNEPIMPEANDEFPGADF